MRPRSPSVCPAQTHPLGGASFLLGRGDRMVMMNDKPDKDRPHWWEWVLIATMLAIIVCILLFADPAGAAPIKTQEVLRDILADRDSPLASVADTPAAFWRGHRGFDIAGWLAVVWAETNLARDSFARRTNNIGCVRGGKVGRPWRDWRVATTASGFNVYESLYMGQRAHIRLIDARYSGYLRRHQWDAFAAIYWGPDYPSSYVDTLGTAHDKIVADAAERGLKW